MSYIFTYALIYVYSTYTRDEPNTILAGPHKATRTEDVVYCSTSLRVSLVLRHQQHLHYNWYLSQSSRKVYPKEVRDDVEDICGALFKGAMNSVLLLLSLIYSTKKGLPELNQLQQYIEDNFRKSKVIYIELHDIVYSSQHNAKASILLLIVLTLSSLFGGSLLGQKNRTKRKRTRVLIQLQHKHET